MTYHLRHQKRYTYLGQPAQPTQPPQQLPLPPTRRPPRQLGTKTHQQARKDTVAGRISKNWPSRPTQKSKIGRGIDNSRVQCYQNSVLQALMHLPKFVNLIFTHQENKEDDKKSGKKGKGKEAEWPCETPGFQGCAACILKGFAQTYWRSAGREPLDNSDPALDKLRQLAYSYFDEESFYHSPGSSGHSHSIHHQQDAEEFFGYLFSGLESATQPERPGTNPNPEKLKALFELEMRRARTCECGTPLNPMAAPEGNRGFTTLVRDPPPSPKGRRTSSATSSKETTAHIIHKFMAGEERLTRLEDETCAGCQKPEVHIQSTYQIVSAPEYLRVKIPPWGGDEVYLTQDSPQKRCDFMRVDPELDLTEYQQDKSRKLKYKLLNVVRHAGDSLNRGHYVADVTGYGGKHYLTDDTDVSELKRPLEVNPSGLGSGVDPAGAFILIYGRV